MSCVVRLTIVRDLMGFRMHRKKKEVVIIYSVRLNWNELWTIFKLWPLAAFIALSFHPKRSLNPGLYYGHYLCQENTSFQRLLTTGSIITTIRSFESFNNDEKIAEARIDFPISGFTTLRNAFLVSPAFRPKYEEEMCKHRGLKERKNRGYERKEVGEKL